MILGLNLDLELDNVLTFRTKFELRAREYIVYGIYYKVSK